MSTAYTTLASLDYNSYVRLQTDFPGFEELVLEQIYSYQTNKKKLFMTSLNKLELFKGVGREAMHSLYFNTRGDRFSPGARLLSVGQSSNNMFYIVSGKVNVDAYIDGAIFNLARLRKGSVFNYRNFQHDTHKNIVMYRSEGFVEILALSF